MSRERAIVVTPRAPWPQDDGGRIALWQCVWAAAQAWDVTVLSFVPPEELDAAIPPEVRALGIAVERVAHRPPPTWQAALRGTFGRWPYTITRYCDDAFAARLRELVRREAPRFVLFNNLSMGVYAPAARPAAVVLRQQNFESSWLERFARTRRNPFVRAFAGYQAARMRRAERTLCEQADLVLAIQADETTALRRLAPRARVELLPLALAPARFATARAVDPPVVLVLGSWNWLPNAEGLARFLAEGMPTLRAAAPRARVRVVGKGMSDALAQAVRAAGAEAVGYVDDVQVELGAARVLLVPLWTGAGVRVKIIEAMAAAVPVVATPMAAEGLAFTSGEDALLADAPAELARLAAGLVLDPARAEAMGARSQARARAEFDAVAVAARMNAWCDSLPRSVRS